MPGCVPGRRRVEHRARFARIGIDAEQQELGRNRAEIDRAVDQRLGRDRPRRRRSPPPIARGRRGRCGLRQEQQIDRFLDPRFRSARASPRRSDRRSPTTRPTTRRPSRPCGVTSKLGFKARQAAQPRSLGNGRARRARRRRVRSCGRLPAPRRARPARSTATAADVRCVLYAPLLDRRRVTLAGELRDREMRPCALERLGVVPARRALPRAHRPQERLRAERRVPAGIHCAQGGGKRLTRCRRAPPGRPWRGHRTPRRSCASFGHRQIAHAHLAQVASMSGQKRSNSSWPSARAGACLAFQPPQHQHGMAA